MHVAIGSDHAGFELKEAVKTFLAAEHHEVVDVGTHNQDPVDYPDYAQAVGAAVRESRAERGILLCGSGVGASMVANRIPGIRAGLCHDTYSAHQGVEHDNMNVLVLGGRVIGIELARELIRAFLNARFTGEPRHVRRLAKLTALENRLRALEVFGQSVWLDYIRRSLIESGELRRLIAEDGVRGVTSNPAIFEKAVAGSSDYREMLEAPEARALDAKTLYERLAVRDIQDACDALRGVYEETARRDGYVSLEVSPFLAHDTTGTLNEARRLWSAVGRENVMIKVPATAEGVPAIEQLISEGINVNVTLLFALEAYERAADAYIAGLEKLIARGGDPTRVASVASFFVSRIDTAVDALIDGRVQASTNAREQSFLRGLTGRVAIANAKLAYQRYQELFGGRRWQALAAQGARTQRLLWASTGAKNPGYRDVVYVEELIGPDTVNTIPPATFEAFRDHGRPRASLTEDVDAARDTMDRLAQVGISMDDVTDRLLAEGVRLFEDAFAKLLKAVEKQSKEAGAGKINRLTYSLPEPLAAAVNDSLTEWRVQGKVRRLWGRDASVWTGKDEAHWLGWLGVTNDQLAHIDRLTALAHMVRSAGFSHALLLGMGGSSLGPEVLKTTFGKIRGFPELHVLDSTDPAQVQTFENKIDLKNTLFIVSSKSGSTLEPNIFKQYFFDRVTQLVGVQAAGRRFVAITDPGSKLQQLAESDGFRHVFFGWPDIGGRYSVLSDFGLVPAAIMGVDVAKLLDRTEAMVSACIPSVPVGENPGVVLGAILGVAARDFGRDKVTIIASPGLAGSRRLAGAAAGGVDGQGRRGPDPHRPRSPRSARGLRRRPSLRLSPIAVGTRCGQGHGRRRAGARRSSRRAHRRRRPVRPRRGILSLGDGDRRGRFDPGHPSVRSAGRGSQQERDEKTHRRVRANRDVARRDADLHRGRNQAFHRRDECERIEGRVARRAHAGGLSHRAPQPAGRRRLLRAARVHRDERGARAGVASNARGGSRRQARRDVPGVRPALLALDGPGLQGRAEHGRVPADHVR